MSVIEYFDEVYEIKPWERLLLESLILPAPRGHESFTRWLAEIDLGAMDFPTLRLLPALFRKFGSALAGTPDYERIKGIYRHFHFRNSLIISAGRGAIEKLLDARIEVLLFKGISIALKYHESTANRPMGDIDVLVRRESIPHAEKLLRECGYRYLYAEGKKSSDVHSHDYTNQNYSGFDLHWYSLYESPRAGIDDAIWGRAEFFDWDGLVVKVMSPEDLLFTSIVNGVRDIPIHTHWIHDVATIVDAEPVILWGTVWEEARKRDLREQVFNALNLVRGISGKTVPDALLHDLINNDPEFRKDVLKCAITEGRTLRLIHAGKGEIESILSSAGPCPSPFTRGGANLMISKALGAPRHIRYFLDENSAIKGLFLQWRHLPLVAELFEVSDRQMLDDLVSNHPTQGEGHLAVPAGLLAKKLKPTLPTSGARIAVADAPPNLVLSPGQIAEITVEVENNSAYCWPISGGGESMFGVSYHLLSEDGKILIWDLPRCYLATPRKDYVAFIEPSQVLTCKLKIAAPSEPGRYIVQLDLVHERVLWFSQQDNQFPRIDLEVLGREPLGDYVINAPGIVHETMDGETVIIDTTKGNYYSVNGYASLIWNAIVDGYGVSRIVSAFAAAAIFSADEKRVERFVNSLLDEKLIRAADSGGTEPRRDLRVEARFGTQAPVLTRHPESRELIAMHPVSGASKQAGWPHAPDANDSADGAIIRG